MKRPAFKRSSTPPRSSPCSPDTSKNARPNTYGLVATLCGIPAKLLGVKGKSGILQSVSTRRAFLTDTTHRVRFVFVPKHTSWMNHVEIWFSVLSRRVIRRGSFRSTDDLRDRILKFIDYYNDTMAKPYKWTYAGRVLNVGNKKKTGSQGSWIRPR